MKVDDDDTAGLTASPDSITVTEAPGRDRNNPFTVRLDSEPTDTVFVTVTNPAPSDMSISTTSLVFTPADWSTTQSVTVTAVDDPDPDGNGLHWIRISVSSTADTMYTAAEDSVHVTTVDNDGPSPLSVRLDRDRGAAPDGPAGRPALIGGPTATADEGAPGAYAEAAVVDTPLRSDASLPEDGGDGDHLERPTGRDARWSRPWMTSRR